MPKQLQKEANRRSERIRRKKLILFKHACKLGNEEGIDVAVIVFQHGRYYLGVWTQRASWPPDMTEIVSEMRLRGTRSNALIQRNIFPQPRFYTEAGWLSSRMASLSLLVT